MSQKTIIAVIGGGSVFTPELITLLAENSASFGPTEVRLFDIDVSRLTLVTDFCQRMLNKMGSEVKLIISSDRKSTLLEADYVLIQLRQGGQEARIQDELLGKKYQIPFVETISICGFATFLRTFYEFEGLAADIKQYAPQAFVLNFSNPAGHLTEALYRMGLEKVIGVCNSWMGLQKSITQYVDVKGDELFMHYRGLNHLTVVDAAYNAAGENLVPSVIAALPDEQDSFSLPSEIIRKLGVLPNHYLQYYFNNRAVVKKQQVQEQVRSQKVQEINEILLEQYQELDFIPQSLEERGGYGYSKTVVNIIKGIHCNEGSRHYAVVKNQGAIAFLPEDAFIETPVYVNRSGVYPICLPELPLFFQPLVFSIKQYERVAIQGAFERDRNTLLKAMLMHPLMNDYNISAPLLEECLELNKEYLPEIQ